MVCSNLHSSTRPLQECDGNHPPIDEALASTGSYLRLNFSMIIRRLLWQALSPGLRFSASPLPTCCRQAHSHAQQSTPSPTPFVPDTNTFLTLIGRNLIQHASKFPNWNSLFSLSSSQLRELGVEPARTRRYLIWWRDRFRKGVFGIGGDLKDVHNGEAEVRVVEVPVSEKFTDEDTAKRLGLDVDAISPNLRRMVVNEPADVVHRRVTADQLTPIQGLKVRGTRTLVGPFIKPIKGTNGSVATIKVQEGMWEIKRGVKLDGGERRRKMVRRQKLLEQRRKTRG